MNTCQREIDGGKLQYSTCCSVARMTVPRPNNLGTLAGPLRTWADVAGDHSRDRRSPPRTGRRSANGAAPWIGGQRSCVKNWPVEQWLSQMTLCGGSEPVHVFQGRKDVISAIVDPDDVPGSSSQHSEVQSAGMTRVWSGASTPGRDVDLHMESGRHRTSWPGQGPQQSLAAGSAAGKRAVAIPLTMTQAMELPGQRLRRQKPARMEPVVANGRSETCRNQAA